MKVEQKFSSSQTPRLNSPQTQKPWVQEGMKQYIWILDHLAPTMVVFKINIALLMEYGWEIHCKWIIDRIVSVLKLINLAEISPPDAAPSVLLQFLGHFVFGSRPGSIWEPSWKSATASIPTGAVDFPVHV